MNSKHRSSHLFVRLALLVGGCAAAIACQSSLSQSNPEPIPKRVAGLTLWLDGADGSTITQSSGRVSRWNDKSGNGNNVAQPVTANRPAISRATLKFGTMAVLSNATPSALPLGRSAATILVVGSQTPSNRYGGPIAWGGSTSYILDQNPTGQYVFGSGPAFVGTHAKVNRAPHLLSVAFRGGVLGAPSVDVYLDGSPQPTWASNKRTATVDAGPLRVGFYSSGANTISELLVYRNVLSPADRQTVEGYLAWKWGLQAKLAASHPYRRGPPRGTPAYAQEAALTATP